MAETGQGNTERGRIDVLEAVEALPPLPAVALRVMEVAQNPKSSASDLALVVSSDPGLSGRLLRVVNSAAYRRAREITSVQEALVTVGFVQARNMAISGAIAGAYAPDALNALFRIDTFWRHSIAVAFKAAELAGRGRRLDVPSAFTAGILHNMGRLAMFYADPAGLDQAVAVAMKQITDPPIPPRDLVPTIPPVLEAVVLHSLAKRPSERFRTAEEFSRALLDARGEIEGTTGSTRVMPGVGAMPTEATSVMGQPTATTRVQRSRNGAPPPSEDPPRRRRRWPWVVAAIVVLIAIAGVAYAVMSGGDDAPMVTVPDVTSQPVARAEKALKDLKFAVTTRTQVDANTAQGRVIRTTPPAGTQAPEGSTVTLVVSGGPGKGTVPNVVGESETAAVAAVVQAGFEADVNHVADPDVPEGEVISQDPAGNTQADKGGVGTDSPITIEFGKVWKLELHDNGNAVLYEVSTNTDTGATVDTPRGQFEWMTAEQFRGTVHQLWIYQVQSKLIIANVNQSLEGRRAGFVYRDDGAQLSDTLDGEGEQVRNAIRAAKWKVSGGGFCTVNVSNQAWVAGAATVTMNPTAIDQGGSTMELESATAHGASNGAVAASIACVDEDLSNWSVGTSTTSRRYGIGWSVTWTGTTSNTFFLDAVDVKIPRLLRTEGGSGTDVLAIANVGDRAVELVREGDLTRERLTARLVCFKQDLAGYVQPNMTCRYVVDNVTRFRGLTVDAQWSVIAEGATQSGQLTLAAEGLFKRFRKQLWPGGKPFDGRLLTECLAEVLEAGGLSSSDYSLVSWPVRFADTPRGEAPAFVYRPGTNLDRILEDFQRKFYGTSLFHYFRLSDGLFVLAQVVNTGSAAATFYAKSSDAAGAGVPYRTIRDGSFTATFDESELYNVVIVLGQAPDGRPLMARCIDWPSIRDSSVANYTGEPWPLVVVDPASRRRGWSTTSAANSTRGTGGPDLCLLGLRSGLTCSPASWCTSTAPTTGSPTG